jgi:hypothetical protein
MIGVATDNLKSDKISDHGLFKIKKMSCLYNNCLVNLGPSTDTGTQRNQATVLIGI